MRAWSNEEEAEVKRDKCGAALPKRDTTHAGLRTLITSNSDFDGLVNYSYAASRVLSAKFEGVD